MIGFRVSHARINDLADGACEWKNRKKKTGQGSYNDGVLDTLFNGSMDETIDI